MTHQDQSTPIYERDSYSSALINTNKVSLEQHKARKKIIKETNDLRNRVSKLEQKFDITLTKLDMIIKKISSEEK